MHFEDFVVGQSWTTGRRRLDGDEMIAFAEAWDWQRFHLDPAAAAATPFGGIVASGFQTLLVAFGLTLDLGLWDESGLGSPGMDSVRWLAPVRPGDTLDVEVEVIAARPSRSKPDRGVVTLAHDVRRDDGATVMTFETMVMLARREPTAPE
ncbi:MAG: MaoC family dehydratase [Paracoccaceae bacterium]